MCTIFRWVKSKFEIQNEHYNGISELVIADIKKQIYSSHKKIGCQWSKDFHYLSKRVRRNGS